MSFLRDNEVAFIADAIVRYLEARPAAAETVDGVANWWLRRLFYEESRPIVQRALDYLVATGEVERVVGVGGTITYRKSSTQEDDRARTGQ